MEPNQYQSVDQLVHKLSCEPDKIATKRLTQFCAHTRFRVSNDEFLKQYVDGSDDGGIDFYHIEESRFFIFQTKFCAKPKKIGVSEILDELAKIKNSLIGVNPNKRAEEFVADLKHQSSNPEATLEIGWLTTNFIQQSVIDTVESELRAWRNSIGWSIAVDFVAIDYHALDASIYDWQHGYIPYTGKRVLRLDHGQWIEQHGHEESTHSVVCTLNVHEILKWFKDNDSIEAFLQKNVRDFLGEGGKINRDIQKSYVSDPCWFWYKHNGIIVLADNLFVDRDNDELVLRNPQIVNGGQTLRALYLAYKANSKHDNGARILLRVYRLSHSGGGGYKRSLEIISALNSQNRITPSDLKSTDPRQVRLERLFPQIGFYRYFRKRSVDVKAAAANVTMRNLAIRYYVCKKNVPHEGVEGKVEELFEEESKYDQVFNENAINNELNGNHVVYQYATCWTVDQLIKKVELPNKKQREFFPYIKWFVLADIYSKLLAWKQERFHFAGSTWIQFIRSPHFEAAVSQYSRIGFAKGVDLTPSYEEPRAYLKRKDATEKFAKMMGVKAFSSEINWAFKSFCQQSGLTE